MNYAEAIKALRKKMLITQTELATMLGVAFVSVNRWENGVFEPSLKQKRKLHKLFIEAGLIEK